MVTLDAALSILQENPPAVVLLDYEPANGIAVTEHIQTIRKDLTSLLLANAMVHTAVASSFGHTELHDALEGYGLLAGLPAVPGPEDVTLLADSLEKCVAIYSAVCPSPPR